MTIDNSQFRSDVNTRPADQAAHLAKIAAAVDTPINEPTAPKVNGVDGYNSSRRPDRGATAVGPFGSGAGSGDVAVTSSQNIDGMAGGR